MRLPSFPIYLGALFVVAFAQDRGKNAACQKGYWGANCQNACGFCALDREMQGPYDRECDSSSGTCRIACQDGWTGLNCDNPICDTDCNGGKCVYPGVCGNCPNPSLVAPGCQSLRLRGLLGALVSLVVLTSCLALCTCVSSLYQKRKSKEEIDSM